MFLQSIQPHGLIVGALLILGGVWLFVDRNDTARWLYDYYNSRKDPRWRPRWLPWAFRPTRRQAMILASVFGFAVFAFGMASFVFGLGVDLREPFE